MREALGLIVGVAVAFAIVFLGEQAIHSLLAMPTPPAFGDKAGWTRYMASVPTGTAAALVLNWFVAAFLGGTVGRIIGRRHWIAWTVAIVVLAATVLNFVLFPHPLWMILAGLLAPLLAAWLATRTPRQDLPAVPPTADRPN